MAATTVKNDPIKNDKMKFRTQMVDGKPQIFFDAIDDSAMKTRSKRNSRVMNNTSRLIEQQKSKINNQKPPLQNGTNKQTNRTEQPPNKIRVNEDGSSLGVYMTMDELAELVKAVKDNAKSDNNTITETRAEPPPERYNQTTTTSAPFVPKLDLASEPLPPPTVRISPREQTLSIMADKKRQKWIREKAEIERMQLEVEYDQLKHQLSPGHKKSSVSPERSTFQYDFPPPAPPPPTNKPPPAPPLPQSLKQTDRQHDVPAKFNEDTNDDAFKTRLMEKKQQQWKQENSEKMPLWNPFGRPGAGAPNGNESQPRTAPPSNTVVPYRPSVPQQQFDNSPSSFPPTFLHSDQTHVPAAMRTNLLFGDVRFDEDVKTAKEIERRQWLDDLQKQIEDNKRKKYTQQETERRQDFLNENVHPIVQEAANRHHQQREITTINNPKQDLNKYHQHETSVQQTYDKILEASDLATYEKRSQLIDKLKRNGHQTDSLVKTLPNIKSTGPASNEKTGEKLFGPTYDLSTKQNTTNKVEPLHLNVAVDQQKPYRLTDARRDEAVNTVGSTFRSDHSVQTDLRIPPHRPTAPYACDESDLPPQNPNHHYRNSAYRNIPNQPGKRNTRMHSLDDDHPPPRRTSTTTYHSNLNDDSATSQISLPRSYHGPVDAQNRPLWNYNNREHREYVPNSKRDPHYEKRQRLKHFEQGNFDRIDDVQKKTCYNRWNSDSELQQQRKQIPTNRVRSTISKGTSYGNHRDESIMNLLKTQNKQQQQETYGTRKSAMNHIKNDDVFNSNREPSLDKYENYVPYTRADEVLDLERDNSPVSRSRETTPYKQSTETNTNNNYQQQEWENTNRQNPLVQSAQYNPPQSRQEHILQQLSAIKENLVRRQRELASSINPIPV